MRVLESLDVISSDRGKNRCTYFLKMDQLNARLNSENNPSHPATQSPRHTVTPSHSRKGGVTQSPLPRHTDTLPRHTGSYLTREPSLNRHGTVNEPSIGKTKKPKTEIDSLKSIGTLEEVKAFAKELGLPESDGEHMWHKWDESEWTKNAGKEKIKDWRKTLKTWKSGGWLPSQKSPTINHSSAASTQTHAEARQEAARSVNPGNRAQFSTVIKMSEVRAQKAREAAEAAQNELL